MRRSRPLAVTVAAGLGLAALLAAHLSSAQAPSAGQQPKFDYQQKIMADPPSGPPPLKKRLAVARFDDSTTVDDSPFGVMDPQTLKKYQNDDINSIVSKDLAVIRHGFTERMTTLLFATDRFLVVERRDVNKILREQDFTKTGRMANTPKLAQGEVLSAQYIITGIITLDHGEGLDSTSDSEVQLSIPIPGSRFRTTVGSGRATSAEPGATEAAGGVDRPGMGDRSLLDQDAQFECPRDRRVPPRYAFHMRVYDVATSQVVSAVRVSANNQWCLIKAAVSRMIIQMDKFPWRTRVTAVEGDRVAIAGGRDVNMGHGYRFTHQPAAAADNPLRVAKAPADLSVVEVHDLASVMLPVVQMPADAAIRPGDWMIFNPAGPR